MVAGDLVMKVPPHALDWVALRAVCRQEVQVDPLAVLPQVDRHRLARVALRVVADHVDLPVVSQPAPQVVEVRKEQRRVSPLLRCSLGQEDLAGPPMDRPGQVTLLVVAGRLDLRLLSLDHPHRADLWIGIDVDLVLEDDRLIGGQARDQRAQGVQLGLPLPVGRPDGRSRSAVNEVAAMEPAADGLTADLGPVFAEHQRDDGLAAPAAAEEAKVARRVLGDPLDDGSDPRGGEAKGAAGLVASHPLNSFGLEPLDPAVDGPGATEQDRADGGPRVPVIQEQEDVSAESDIGVAVSTVSVEQRSALVCVESDAAIHGRAFRVLRMSGSAQLYRAGPLSVLRGAI